MTFTLRRAASRPGRTRCHGALDLAIGKDRRKAVKSAGMEQFEQLLTCAICLDRYRNPKLLPCQHSFCMEPCMDGLVDYVRRQVKCPECRAEHRIPYQGVQAFPTNVTLQRFLELHIEITGELPDPTSGQTMERCGVCSEKSYCSLCVHCEKKCCPECKDAHMDILRREITRINSQVRRGLHRLQDALALVEKNTLGLQTNCAAVAEEVDEIYRRLSKALKDRTEYLRNEVDRYLGTELRGLIQLKENLELEIANIQSNCDLAEAHINENVPWDDSELLDTKELFLRTVEFIRNFEYEAGDYNRRVRFVMAHDPNQLVLHVAGYGELNIKPESGSGGLLGSSSSLAPPGGSPGLMRSKSDHRLASQYRQQEEERLARNRYVPEYEYDAPEYDSPRNKSRYRSRFMRHRDGDDSDGDSRSTVRFTSTPQESTGSRERVLDTEDAARGPLSGIFRLTDSPRVMKKLQECERAGKRKKEESAQPAQPQAPKPQVQVRIAPTAMARQVSEDDEISRIKKQNKNAPQPTTTAAATVAEAVEERQPQVLTSAHPQGRDPPAEREPEEAAVRRPPTITRRTSGDTHAPATRSASSDSSTGSESSTGSGIRSTGAPFTAEEMKQKYLSRAPATNTTTSTVTASSGRDSTASSVPASRPFQSRFLGAGNRAAPPPPATTTQPTTREETRDAKKKDEDEEEEEEETSSSSEETESETEEESETESHPTTATTSSVPQSTTSQERQRNDAAMARTDIGALLARSAEARRGSKEDSPSTRYSTPRGSPAHTVTSPTSPLTTTMTPLTPAGTGVGVPVPSTGGYSSSRFVEKTSVLDDMDDDHDDNDNNNDNSDNRANILKTFASGRNVIEVGPIKRYDDLENNAIRGSLTIRGIITNKPNEDVALSELVRPEFSIRKIQLRAGNDSNSKTGINDKMTMTMTTDTNTNTSSHSSSQSVNSITDRRLEGSNHDEAGEHQRDNVVTDGREVNGSTTVSEKREDEKAREYKTDKPQDVEEDEDDDDEEEDEEEEGEDGSTKKNENGIPEGTNVPTTEDQSVPTEDDGSSSESVEDEDDRTVISVRQGSDSDRTARGSSLLSDRSNEEDLFDDNGWLVTDQDLELDERRSKTREHSLEGDDQKKSEKLAPKEEALETESKNNGDSSKSPENSLRSRVYRQSNLGKNGWLISDESESESERAVSPVDKTTESRNNDDENEETNANVTTSKGDTKESDNESKRNPWSIEENGWMIVHEDQSTMRNHEPTKDPPATEKTDLKRGRRSSTIRSQTTTDLVSRANVENGALVANATRSKETERSDEHEDASDVDISIPMQMVPEQEQKPSCDGAGTTSEPSTLLPRSRYAALKERRQRLARSRSSHNFGGDEVDLDEEPPSPTTQSPNAYLAAKYGAGSELARSRSTHALKSREPSPERDRSGAEKDGAALSSWARYLKNKYGNRTAKDKEPPSTTTSIPSSSASATSRRLSLGLPLRHTGQTSFESSDDDQKNPSGSPTSPTAAPVIPAAAGSSTRSNYLLKRRQLFKFGMRGSEAGCFTWPRGLAIGPDNTIVVADSSNHRVQPAGRYRTSASPCLCYRSTFDALCTRHSKVPRRTARLLST
ncbi:hypothetical protein KPH14_009037 [Odynerus spinipes]|uniref:RING-type domain-containing protein n=1 Tax=Odynerus spinipes TaxID=1348599 RepID=A0AAD9VQ57_9HYME|nr:hypothetical protein KPH14_009037 [Odynerus spinipes]